MSTDAVLIIVGAVFLVIGLAGKILVEKIKLFVFLESLASKVAIAFVGIVLMGFGIFIAVGQPTAVSGSNGETVELGEPPDPVRIGEGEQESCDVSITNPSENGVVRSPMTVSGTYGDGCTDDIWVFVWPELAPGVGWPQSNDSYRGTPALKRNDQWRVTCYFGGPPQSYTIVAYTADEQASSFISNALMDQARMNNYTGIREGDLPDGLIEKHRISVRKQ